MNTFMYYFKTYLDGLKKYAKEETVRFFVLFSLLVIMIWSIAAWIKVVFFG